MAETVLVMMKGGCTKSLEVVLMQELQVLAILIGGGGAQKVSTL